MQGKFHAIICVILSLLLICGALTGATAAHGHGSKASAQCKELNQVNCYAGRNEGYYCNSKVQSGAETRWYYDKGVCRQFAYKGCNGNRNRFCTRESCERRCSED